MSMQGREEEVVSSCMHACMLQWEEEVVVVAVAVVGGAVVPLVMAVPLIVIVPLSSPSLSSLSLSLCCRGIGHGRHVVSIAVSMQGRVMMVSLCMRTCVLRWVVSSLSFGWEVVVVVVKVVMVVVVAVDTGVGGWCCCGRVMSIVVDGSVARWW